VPKALWKLSYKLDRVTRAGIVPADAQWGRTKKMGDKSKKDKDKHQKQKQIQQQTAAKAALAKQPVQVVKTK
jgi:hypothetical protein